MPGYLLRNGFNSALLATMCEAAVMVGRICGVITSFLTTIVICMQWTAQEDGPFFRGYLIACLAQMGTACSILRLISAIELWGITPTNPVGYTQIVLMWFVLETSLHILASNLEGTLNMIRIIIGRTWKVSQLAEDRQHCSPVTIELKTTCNWETLV
jgi:hypothetical protein